MTTFSAKQEAAQAQTGNSPLPHDMFDEDDSNDPAMTRNPAKMNKAGVLGEAVIYIQQLEEENEVLLDQFKILVRRTRAARKALEQDAAMRIRR